MRDRCLSYLLNMIWAAVLIAVAPVLLYRAIRFGKYRSGWSQKLLGRVPELAAPMSDGRYWFHAVSVGEVLLLPPVLAELKSRCPELDVVISTTTSTGYAVAREKFPEHCVCYWPLDFSWSVKQALRRIKPTRVVLVELELWPNFLLFANRLGVPVSLINGRLSEKSFHGYARLRFLIAPLLKTLDCVAAQNAAYAERFLALGATPQQVHVTGSVKFDRVETDRSNARVQALHAAFGLKPDAPVFIAGSTQAPEEEIALNAWRQVRQHSPALRLILVPRHKERFDEVARLVQSKALPLLRRTDTLTAAAGGRSRDTQIIGKLSQSPDEPVILLDTLGELSSCWGLADFAFVGGSLTRRGGQNMIEPAGYGAAVCFGRDTRNFRDIVEALLTQEAARVVRNGDELAATLIHWLEAPLVARLEGERARRFVLSQHGAAARTALLLLEPERAARRLTSNDRVDRHTDRAIENREFSIAGHFEDDDQPFLHVA